MLIEDNIRANEELPRGRIKISISVLIRKIIKKDARMRTRFKFVMRVKMKVWKTLIDRVGQQVGYSQQYSS